MQHLLQVQYPLNISKTFACSIDSYAAGSPDVFHHLICYYIGFSFLCMCVLYVYICQLSRSLPAFRAAWCHYIYAKVEIDDGNFLIDSILESLASLLYILHMIKICQTNWSSTKNVENGSRVCYGRCVKHNKNRLIKCSV